MNSCTYLLYVIAGLSVTFVCPTQATEIWYHLVPWPPIDIQVKFYEDCPRGTPPSGELNTTGVAEYIAILNISNAISRKRCKIGAKLLLITNRKSDMSFRLVPNLVTLDDLEWSNSPNGHIISRISVAFVVDYVKVIEGTPILSAAEM